MSPQAIKSGKSIYRVHPGVAMAQKWIQQLKDNTGRSLDEWIRMVQKEGPKIRDRAPRLAEIVS